MFKELLEIMDKLPVPAYNISVFSSFGCWLVNHTERI